MPITQADIEKVAHLAHLELAEEELNTFGPQITEIVSYVEQPATHGNTRTRRLAARGHGRRHR